MFSRKARPSQSFHVLFNVFRVQAFLQIANGGVSSVPEGISDWLPACSDSFHDLSFNAYQCVLTSDVA